jgi:hypothetical protein
MIIKLFLYGLFCYVVGYYIGKKKANTWSIADWIVPSKGYTSYVIVSDGGTITKYINGVKHCEIPKK